MTDLGSALTLGQMVDRAAARFPDRTAVVFKQERISYADLKRRADEFARGLLALGLRAGDHVVLWMPNRVEWNVANLGIAKIGAVTGPLPADRLRQGAEVQAEGLCGREVPPDGAGPVIGAAP